MRLVTKNKPKPNLDMTSATDIMFLLLIFFMIAVSSVSQQSIQVNLPVTTTAEQCSTQLSITITADIKFYIENQFVEKENLKTILSEKTKENGRDVMLYIDKSVPVEYVVFVADIVSALGMKMAVATMGRSVEALFSPKI